MVTIAPAANADVTRRPKTTVAAPGSEGTIEQNHRVRTAVISAAKGKTSGDQKHEFKLHLVFESESRKYPAQATKLGTLRKKRKFD